MTKADKKKIIDELLEEEDSASTNEKLDIVIDQINLIMSAIIVQQKDAAQLAGVSAATIRNYAKEGKIKPLQKDGSRLNFYTLKEVDGMRRRNTSKR